MFTQQSRFSFIIFSFFSYFLFSLYEKFWQDFLHLTSPENSFPLKRSVTVVKMDGNCPTGTSEEGVCCLFHKIQTMSAVISVLGASYQFSQKKWSNGKQLLQRLQSSGVSVCSIDGPLNRGFIFLWKSGKRFTILEKNVDQPTEVFDGDENRMLPMTAFLAWEITMRFS